jgi:hypothetical protein
VDRRGEARLPATIAVIVAIALYAALPDDLLVGPRFVVPLLELLLLGAVVAVNPRRVTRETRQSRAPSRSDDAEPGADQERPWVGGRPAFRTTANLGPI